MGRDSFVNHHAGLHLLKPPSPDKDGAFAYQTMRVDAKLDPTHIVPSDCDWQWTPVRKKPGNPYPTRISVGRALNCDIVLRFAMVSKLHAHFTTTPDGGIRLVDLGSANGTSINGEPLTSATAVALGAGDEISFGGLECRIVDAMGLFELVGV